MLSRLSNSELAYLDGILIASTIVVIVEGKIDRQLRTGNNLPDGGEVIIVGIRRFCLSREQISHLDHAGTFQAPHR